MKFANAVERIRAFLGIDWEAEFARVVAANGGEIPRMPQYIYERTKELGRLHQLKPREKQGK